MARMKATEARFLKRKGWDRVRPVRRPALLTWKSASAAQVQPLNNSVGYLGGGFPLRIELEIGALPINGTPRVERSDDLSYTACGGEVGAAAGRLAVALDAGQQGLGRGGQPHDPALPGDRLAVFLAHHGPAAQG